MRRLLQFFFPILSLAILGFVWSVPIQNAGGWTTYWTIADPSAFIYRLFQLAGLTAFTLVSLQILTGPYMKFWEHLYGPRFYKFHAYEGLFALLFALLHPSLLLVSLNLQKVSYFDFVTTLPYQFYFGPFALLLMVTTVSTAALTILFGRPAFQKSWHWIHLANYGVFLLVFFHSISIGSDVASPTSTLRPLWWLFLAGMIVGLLYRRVYRVITEKDAGLG